jgi:hypothetical protein
MINYFFSLDSQCPTYKNRSFVLSAYLTENTSELYVEKQLRRQIITVRKSVCKVLHGPITVVGIVTRLRNETTKQRSLRGTDNLYTLL